MADRDIRKDMKEALDGLSKAVDAICVAYEDMDKSDLTSLLKCYKDLHEWRDRFEIYRETISHMHDQLSYETLPELMEAHHIDSIKQHGRNFVLTVRTMASIPEDQRSAAHKWIRDVAGTPGIIVEGVNPKSLASLVKSYFDEHGKFPPKEVIKIFQKRYISVKKP